MRIPLVVQLITIASLTTLSGCTQLSNTPKNCAEAGTACTKFTILHTNDHHGRFWQNKDGEYGMAARKTLIDQIRTEAKLKQQTVLLFSGGDINTGVPESDLLNAEPDFIGMNHIGYDAMAVGNHEFDNPLSVLEQQRQWANFPMLSANIYRTEQQQGQNKQVRYFEPYKIFEIDNLKLAVVGLTTDETAQIGHPEYVRHLTFTPPQQEIVKVIAKLKQQHNIDIVFAISHMGHYADGKHGSNAAGDVKMARALEPGLLQAIFGGHSQNPVCMKANSNQYADFKAGDPCTPDQQNGTWIVQAHEWGKYVARADFEYFNHQLHLAKFELIPVNLKQINSQGQHVLIANEITQDPILLQRLKPYQQLGQEKLDEVISNTNAELIGERNIVRNQQTNLGQLIAKAHTTNGVKADFAIINSGGIRTSISSGPISYRDVLSVQPFANMVTLNKMTGLEIKKYLSTVATISRGSGGYAQISGIEMTVDCQSNQIEINKINQRPFNESEQYQFTVPSYNTAGGNNYPILANAINTGFVDADLLYQYFKLYPRIDAANYQPHNQITYLNATTQYGCD